MPPILEKSASLLYRQRLWIALIIFSSYFIVLSLRVALFHRQPDFTTYYYACKAHELGSNPYDIATLSSLAGTEITRPFLYPPVSLHLLKLFSLFEYPIAYQIFLFLKLAVMCGLIGIWWKYFCKTDTERGLMLILAAFAFDHAFHRDLNAGNITVFEQLLLWIGLVALMKSRLVVCAIFLAVASLMKPLNLVLLIPLTILPDRQWWKIPVMVIGLSVFLHGLTAVLEPVTFARFLDHASLTDERGSMNPSSFALSRDIMDPAMGALNMPGTPASLVLYGIVVVAVLVLFFHARKKLPATAALMICLIAFALISPRFKDYSYALLILPAVLLMTRGRLPIWIIVLTFLIVCTHVMAYQSLLAAVWLFGTYLYVSRREDGDRQRWAPVPVDA